jgi:hypothetical protein
MKTWLAAAWAGASLASAAILCASSPRGMQTVQPPTPAARNYLGFDRNIYPGDANLSLLKQTFSFCGYWLDAPPGESSNTWLGKRELLNATGFGFLVLFDGRRERELKTSSTPDSIGARDATIAAETAKSEGFSPGTVIFIDQEEGGRMLPDQRAYLHAWIDGVNASGFRAGVYCSAIPAKEGGGTSVITANDIRENAGGRPIEFFVYNDACPPSPGCSFPAAPPSPTDSGVLFAAVWQFAQSPGRRAYIASCPSHYDRDGNCYAPLIPPSGAVHVDVESATSPDPSAGRR